MAELWWLQWILLVWIFCNHQLIFLTSCCNFIPSAYYSAGHLHALSWAGLLRRVRHFCWSLQKGKGLVFLLYSLNLSTCMILIVEILLFVTYITGMHDNFILLNCTSWSLLIRDYHAFYLIWIISWWSYVKFEDEKLRLCIYFTVTFCFSPSVLRYETHSMVEI